MRHPNPEVDLLHQLIQRAATSRPDAVALSAGAGSRSYERLSAEVDGIASGLMALGVQRTDRIGIWLEKRFETVVASFAGPAAGGVMVPMNPLLAEAARQCGGRCRVRLGVGGHHVP